MIVTLWVALAALCAQAQEVAAPEPQPRQLAASATKSPGNASYSIEASLDPQEHLLTGRQRLTWRNLQENPTDELWFHLYWNGWRNDRSTWLLGDRLKVRQRGIKTPEERDWGYSRVRAARLLAEDGEPFVDLMPSLRFEAPDDGNPDDRTVMVLTLPRPVEPNETVEVELDWEARIPRTFARTGVRGNFYFIAHWFPKLGVYEPEGWNCHQYHVGTEYYSDYGSYDVTLTVPSDFVLGATGMEVDRQENPDGTSTVRFEQDDVHAFTWTASPDYEVVTDRFEEPGLPPVDIRLLMQPEHMGQAARHLHATRMALLHYGTWFGPYPYGHVTVIDPAWGSGAGGMEYPTIFTAGTRLFNPVGGGSPEGVTIHEAGHQFWYGLVGNNEFEHAWLDEGLNTFATAKTYFEAYGEKVPVHRLLRPPGSDSRGFLPLLMRGFRYKESIFGGRIKRFRPDATWDDHSTPTFRYYPGTGGSQSYSKTALWLATFERHWGWESLQQVLSTFFGRWAYRHPRPEDFFAVAEEVTGEDLDWYFDQVHGGSGVFDYSVATVASREAELAGWTEEAGEMAFREPDEESAASSTLEESETADDQDGAASADSDGRHYRTEVVVRRLGEGVFPVDVLLVFEDGFESRYSWDGRERWKVYVEEREAKLDYAVVDPEAVLLLDLDRTNNSRRREAGSKLPGFKIAVKWLVWFQDYLMSMAFFG